MKLRAATPFALAILSLGLVVAVSPAEPAWACSCASRAGQQDERAERIVVGTVTQVTDEAVLLAVESVEKASFGIGDTLGLRVSRGEASCGYDFRVGTRYRVNSINGATGLCDGIRQVSATPSAAGAVPTHVAAPPAPAQTPSGWWLAAGAMLAALAAGVLRLRWHPRQRRPCRRRCTARMTATSSDSAHDSGPSRSEQSTAPFRGQCSLPWSSRRPLATYSRIEHAKTSGGPSNRSLSCRVTDDPIARSTSYPYRTITMCTRAIRTTSLQMTEYPLDEYQPNVAQYFTKL